MDNHSLGASAVNVSALAHILDRIHAHNSELEAASVGFHSIAERLFGPGPEKDGGSEGATVGSPAVIDQINAALSRSEALIAFLRKTHRRLETI